MDRKALIGLLFGVTVVVATLIGVGLVNSRPAEGAWPVRTTPHDCARGVRPADAGYGPESSSACVRGS